MIHEVTANSIVEQEKALAAQKAERIKHLLEQAEAIKSELKTLGHIKTRTRKAKEDAEVPA